MPEGQFRGDKPAAAPDVRAGFKDRGIAAERGLAGAASKQELPAGRASPAKELFTLPVTQIPAGLAGAPRSPQGLAAGPGTRFIPAGIWPAVPGPLGPRVCAPSFTGPLTSPPFPAVSPAHRSRERRPCPPTPALAGDLGKGNGKAQSGHQHWHGRPKTALSPSHPQELPCPTATSAGMSRNRAEPGQAREERGRGERGRVPRGAAGAAQGWHCQGSCYRGAMLPFLGGTGSLQPQPVPARWAAQGHRTELPPQVLQAQLSSLRLPDPARSWRSPRAADAGQAPIGSTAGPHARSGCRGLRVPGGFGKPGRGGCWGLGQVTGMGWGHSSRRPLNFGVEQQGKQEPREDHNHGFICYDPTVQLID